MLQTYKNNFEIADLEMGGVFFIAKPQKQDSRSCRFYNME